MMCEELQSEAEETVELCLDYLPTQAADSSEGEMGTYTVFGIPASIATSRSIPYPGGNRL